MGTALIQILVFPGLLFLAVAGLAGEFIDRRLYARFQNRMGPPWFQPLADFIKLLSKEELVPDGADRGLFRLMPVFALTAVVTAFFYIPLWGTSALHAFSGDAIVVLYLLTIPTFTYFLGGYTSKSVYALLGSARTLTQLYAYEVPLFLAVLGPCLLAGTWSLSELTLFFQARPWALAANAAGFVIALIALLGKLEKVPFDIPEAETEIVGGAFTEYSGRFLAWFRLSFDIEMITGASLLAAVFLPFGLGLGFAAGFGLYLVKILFLIALIALIRSLVARLRIDQMIGFCWKVLAPVAFLQVIVNLVLKGIFFS
ncbi:MAG: NADH-quinone oxidoreductase subunit H [bacterium]|nr:NADH-quinone oxidoreductase subunit H [bacterium]